MSTVERLEIGPAGAFVVDGARFEMALMALAGGQFRFSEIDLTPPQTTIPLGKSDAAPWPERGLARACSPASPSTGSSCVAARRG